MARRDAFFEPLIVIFTPPSFGGKIASGRNLLLVGNCTRRSSKLDYFISEVIKIEANRRDFGINEINYRRIRFLPAVEKKIVERVKIHGSRESSFFPFWFSLSEEINKSFSARATPVMASRMRAADSKLATSNRINPRNYIKNIHFQNLEHLNKSPRFDFFRI